ncbi:MAG: ATP-binding protein [Flavobacterium sp.]
MMVKKTFPKILGLIVSFSIFFLLLFSILFYYTKKAENDVYDDSVHQFENEINKLLLMESKPIFTTINVDTNWDEFVEFIHTKNFKWYERTIDSELEIYDADYLGVYDVNRQFIIRTPTKRIKSIDFIPKQAMDVLDREGIKKFYMQIPEGVVEVTGASIHSSDDPKKNKTKSFGYFFVVRLLDAKRIGDLEEATGSAISYVDKDSLSPHKNDKIAAFFELKDFQEKTISKLKFERPFDVYFGNIIKLLYAVIVIFIVFVFVSLGYSKKLIFHPLDLVRKVLESSDKRAIIQLKNTTGEFKGIGQLFEENYKQNMELVNARKKAEESEQLKTAFLENLSHEIRTPMNAINGFAELLMNTELSESERKEYLVIIEKSGKNLVSIIDDLIEMSKIESNQIIPNYSSIDLDACLKELHETIRVTIQKNKEIDFRLIPAEIPAGLAIVTDEIKLKQILTNILTNAIKFTEKGAVTFGYTVDESKGLINFTVSDTGYGIDKVEHKKIFGRFKRVKNEMSVKAGGLGLGLAISKAYVDLLGGTIGLDSKIGKGTTFYFSIPLEYDTKKEVKNSEKTVNTIGDMDNEKHVVLIAEDDNINFLLFQKMMQNKNYEIIRAVTGEEAVEACLSNPNIEIVLMDIKMPIMDGYEAVAKIRPVKPELPIIAQTAYSTSEDKMRIAAAGFTDCIVKPLNREKLFELIAKYLNHN